MLASVAWRGGELWPVALAVVALITAATLILYPRQARAVPLRWRWSLPVLRTMAMLALAASLLRPVLIRQKTQEEQGTVLVLLDRSLSMGIADRALSGTAPDRKAVGQLVELAEGLGRLPEEVRSQSLRGISAELMGLQTLAEDIARIGREVEFARLSGRPVREAQSRLDRARDEFLASARRAEAMAKAAGLRGIAAEEWNKLARSPRAEDVRRLVEQTIRRALERTRQQQDALDSELYRTNAQVRRICDELSRASRLDLCWDALAGGQSSLLQELGRRTPVAAFGIADAAVPLILRENGEIAKHLPAVADGVVTDLAGGIAASLRQVGSQNVQAVVLFSDGRQTGPVAETAGLLPANVPAFTVYAASDTMRDVSIERVELPQAVFVNESMSAGVVVSVTGMPPAKVSGEAVISAEDDAPISVPMQLRDKLQQQRLALGPIKLTRPGPQKITISLPVQDGEVSDANNRAVRWVKVLSQKLRVTAIASAPGWDFRYLRGALSRTAWVQLREAVVPSGVASLGMTPQEILEQDLVVLSGVARDALTDAQWKAIARLVKERGGSLILIPSLAAPVASARQHPLADLLPYESGVRATWQTWGGPTPYYHLVPAAGSEDLPVLRLDQPWDELSGFYRYLSIPRLAANAIPRLVVRETNAPVLTEARIGRGRVFCFGMNETWRWRNKLSDSEHEGFWLQLMRYAMDEPYALASGGLYFDADRVAEPGQSVQVRCRVIMPTADAPLPRQIEMSVLQEGELLRVVMLDPSGEAAAGRYRTVLSDLPAGEYELRVNAPTEDGSINELSLPLTVETSSGREMANVTGDRAFLQKLADSSGGKCINLEQSRSLPQLLQRAGAQQARETELPLWDSGYLFIFVLSCLSAEWALRQRFGMA